MEYTVFWEGKTTVHLEIKTAHFKDPLVIEILTCMATAFHISGLSGILGLFCDKVQRQAQIGKGATPFLVEGQL